MAVSVVDLGEEDRFVGAGWVLEGPSCPRRRGLHGVAVLCEHGLARDQPSRGGDLFSHVAAEVPGGDMASVPQENKGIGNLLKYKFIVRETSQETADLFFVRSGILLVFSDVNNAHSFKEILMEKENIYQQ